MSTHTTQGAAVAEIRSRIPVSLRAQLDQLAVHNFRSQSGEVAAAVAAWVAQHQPPGTASEGT
ncbi:hypothetical protein VB739_12295 [Cyanobium gracile UHCC 0281]|uniref:Arc-like DNA binding domain-containing protein n=1 Tax=Cyanobium gracile UHCC 0281 TaxID=3110309 RepID=A0ABU5SXZ0_9CYAN|nr:hypothetical protein [Cyanobium gracile UHCC 0281]